MRSTKIAMQRENQTVMAGHRRLKDGVASARPMPGHPSVSKMHFCEGLMDPRV
jgi:hypothetical protein